LEAGAELTISYIEKLKKMGISEIYIEDDISKDIVIRDVVNEETRLEAIESVKNIMDSYSFSDAPYSAEVIAIVDKIIYQVLSLDDVVVNLMDIKTYDGYTFSHSVNVCILSIITGIKLKLGYIELQELGVGAILHDIGKVMIPSEILLKKSALTDEEYETIKQHSIIGYNILKRIPYISEASASVALNHHERFDGKGYPDGLKNQEIHIYSRIVAIADIYDALSSDRIYRKKVSTNMAIEYLTVIAAPSVDSKILRYFIQIIPQYPLGTEVVLNTGERAIVFKLNKHFPSRPYIRIVFNADGTRKFAYEDINLAERTEYFIVSRAEIVK
jgi:HD-GYP domain-containing protein (c-di-GMP phosphodiesterase class II)